MKNEEIKSKFAQLHVHGKKKQDQRFTSSDQELQAMEVQDIKNFVYVHICSKIMNIHLPQCVGTVETIFKICTQMQKNSGFIPPNV